MKRAIPKNYFSSETLRHLIPQQGLSERYLRRASDVTLACKLTHTYGKYHLTMLHRELAMNEEQTTFQQAEQMADTMNQLSIFHFSPSCFLHTHDEYIDECIDIYQQGLTDYDTFCWEFQELGWTDGKRTPLNASELRRYIASMREVVDFYRTLL